ncbi:unnamed protein product, partial [Mycena citricolor]
MRENRKTRLVRNIACRVGLRESVLLGDVLSAFRQRRHGSGRAWALEEIVSLAFARCPLRLVSFTARVIGKPVDKSPCSAAAHIGRLSAADVTRAGKDPAEDT